MSVLLDRLPFDPLEALRELTRTEAELGELRRRFVADARMAGVSWNQIGESLVITRQSPWEYFSRPARESMASRAATSSLDEDEAMRLALEEISGSSTSACPLSRFVSLSTRTCLCRRRLGGDHQRDWSTSGCRARRRSTSSCVRG